MLHYIKAMQALHPYKRDTHFLCVPPSLTALFITLANHNQERETPIKSEIKGNEVRQSNKTDSRFSNCTPSFPFLTSWLRSSDEMMEVGREENGINTKQEFCRGSPLVLEPFIPLSAFEESICH